MDLQGRGLGSKERLISGGRGIEEGERSVSFRNLDEVYALTLQSG